MASVTSTRLRLSIIAISLASACWGGGNDSGDEDPLSHWDSGAPLSAPRQDLAVAAVETTGPAFALAIGGRDATGAAVATVERYTFGLDTWETIAPVPVPMYRANAIAFGGRIWTLGFLDADGTADGRVYSYESATDTWVEGPPMPPGTERGAAGISRTEGFVFVAGGFRDGEPVADLTAFAAVGTGGNWSILPDVPAARAEPSALNDDVVLVVVGGRGPDGGIKGDTFVFDIGSSTWRNAKRMPTARAGAASTGLTVIGGEAEDGVVGVVESYDAVADSWRARAPMITPRRGMGAAIIEDYPAVVPGGSVDVGLAPVDTVELLYFHLPPGAVD